MPSSMERQRDVVSGHRGIVTLQILGNLYPHYPSKAQKAVSHFKDAASRNEKDPEIWEMLGELLAPANPSGKYPRGRCTQCLPSQKAW